MPTARDRQKRPRASGASVLCLSPRRYTRHRRLGVRHLLGDDPLLELRAGDVISYQTCGGGGYGNVHERDPQNVLRDVREGKVSTRSAERDYGETRRK